MALGSPGPDRRWPTDWRKLLFPEATDEQFADGYAQAVTFGLLMARAQRDPLRRRARQVAKQLGKTNSLIGAALRLLTDDVDNQATLKTSLGTLTRVLDAVNWQTISKGNPDAWLYFYEDFLEVYDNALAQADRLVLHAARSRRGRWSAWWTRRCATRFGAAARPGVAGRDGGRPGRRHGHLPARRAAPDRRDVEGIRARARCRRRSRRPSSGWSRFEMQFGPFAVAQLRLIAEMHPT